MLYRKNLSPGVESYTFIAVY